MDAPYHAMFLFQETHHVNSMIPTKSLTISLSKAKQDGLRDHECKRIALLECSPVPYVPKKDCVQETVSTYKDNHLKMQINKKYGTMSSYLAL